MAKKLIKNTDIRFIATGVEKPRVQLPLNVEYIGMSDAEEYIMNLCTSHVIFLPSRTDTFPLSVLEGLSCGLPGILSTLPVFRELYNHKDAVVMCSELECYVENVLKLYESWKISGYEILTKEARKLAMKYDKKKIISELERKFREIIEQY